MRVRGRGSSSRQRQLAASEASEQLSGHGKSDAVVVLTQSEGKLGTFSYVAVQLADAAG